MEQLLICTRSKAIQKFGLMNIRTSNRHDASLVAKIRPKNISDVCCYVCLF